MPITLPTTTTSTNPPPPPSSSSSPRSSPPTETSATQKISTHLRARLFRPLDLSDARGKGAAATVVLRGVGNVVGFVVAGLSWRAPWWGCLWYVADQVVVTYAVSFVVDARGERRVAGCAVDERFFEFFLAACGVVHVLYMGILLLCVVTLAIFVGETGGFILTIAGAAILPVALLASRPEDGEGGLSLP